MAKSKNPAFGSFVVDNAIIAAGNTFNNIANTLDSNPLLGYTLEVASFALGPASYVIGKALEPFTAPLISSIASAGADRGIRSGYSVSDSLALGVGIVGIGAAAIGLATGGVGRFKSLFQSGREAISNLGSRLKNLKNSFGRNRIPSTLNGILTNPNSVFGRSAQDIRQQFIDDGFNVGTIKAGRKSSSGLSESFSVQGHPEFNNVRVHPGGGRHEGASVTFSGGSVGRVQVVDSSFIPGANSKARLVYIKE